MRVRIGLQGEFKAVGQTKKRIAGRSEAVNRKVSAKRKGTIVAAVGIELTLQTLLRSANPAATEVLLTALESPLESLRIGALRALALRDDTAGHRGLVERFANLPAETSVAICDVPSRAPLLATLSVMIRPETPKLARRAAEIAVIWEAVPTLTAIVEAAQWPNEEFRKVFTDAAVCLAQRLEEQVAAYDPRQRNGVEDPAFARRSALNALSVALDRFDQHRNVPLLEALLLLTPSDEPALLRALRTKDHAAHDALLEALHHSSSRGALRVLANALGDTGSPQQVIDIAAERSEPGALALLFGFVGYPVGLRVRDNAERIDALAWLEPGRVGRIAELSGPQQATAVTIAAASKASRDQLTALISLLIESGQSESIPAACRAIESLPARLATEPLRQALTNVDAGVVALAASMLRGKNYPNAIETLIGLLDHEDARVRTAAQRSLGELTFALFRSNWRELPVEAQRRVGQLVGKADPMVVPSLEAELNAGAVSRRLAALELIDVMGAAEDLVDLLIERMESDPDVGVRVEAASLLGRVRTLPSVLEALGEAACEAPAAVRRAAEKSLQRLGTGPLLAAEPV